MRGLDHSWMKQPRVFRPDSFPGINYGAIHRMDVEYKTFKGGSDPIRGWLGSRIPFGLDRFMNTLHEGDCLRNDPNHPPVLVLPRTEKIARFIVALSGGLSLVVPMLIMRIHEDLDKSFITTSVAVVLFAWTPLLLPQLMRSCWLSLWARAVKEAVLEPQH